MRALGPCLIAWTAAAQSTPVPEIVYDDPAAVADNPWVSQDMKAKAQAEEEAIEQGLITAPPTPYPTPPPTETPPSSTTTTSTSTSRGPEPDRSDEKGRRKHRTHDLAPLHGPVALARAERAVCWLLCVSTQFCIWPPEDKHADQMEFVVHYVVLGGALVFAYSVLQVWAYAWGAPLRVRITGNNTARRNYTNNIGVMDVPPYTVARTGGVIMLVVVAALGCKLTGGLTRVAFIPLSASLIAGFGFRGARSALLVALGLLLAEQELFRPATAGVFTPTWVGGLEAPVTAMALLPVALLVPFALRFLRWGHAVEADESLTARASPRSSDAGAGDGARVPTLEALGLSLPLPPASHPPTDAKDAETRKQMVLAARDQHVAWRREASAVQKEYTVRLQNWRTATLAASARDQRAVRVQAVGVVVAAAMLRVSSAPAVSACALGGVALALAMHAVLGDPLEDAAVCFPSLVESKALRRLLLIASTALPGTVFGGRWRTTGGSEVGPLVRFTLQVNKGHLWGLCLLILGTFLQSALEPAKYAPTVASLSPAERMERHITRALCMAVGLFWGMCAATVAGEDVVHSIAVVTWTGLLGGLVGSLTSSRFLEDADGLRLPSAESASGYRALQESNALMRENTPQSDLSMREDSAPTIVTPEPPGNVPRGVY